MNEDNLIKISTLNYIDSWAKHVRIQARDMKKLFNSNIGTHWKDYSYEISDVADGLDDVIDAVEKITDCVDEIEL